MTVEGHATRGVTTKNQRGTPCYRAPELFANKPTYTTKVDIWAIGCIMFEFMTREKAFKDDIDVLRFSAGIGVELDFSGSRFNDKTNTFLEALIRQLLSIHVAERPSAQTLLQKLEGLALQSVEAETTKAATTAAEAASMSGWLINYDWVTAGDPTLKVKRDISGSGNASVFEVCARKL
jgi:serine/threonine protein kinase